MELCDKFSAGKKMRDPGAAASAKEELPLFLSCL